MEMHLTTMFTVDKNEPHTETTLRRYVPKERLNIGCKPLFNTRLDYFQAISLIWIKEGQYLILQINMGFVHIQESRPHKTDWLKLHVKQSHQIKVAC